MPTDTEIPQKQFKDANQEELLENLRKFMVSGQNFGSLRGLTRGDLDGIYAMGHGHYTAGNYEEAEKFFRALCMLDHKELRNWMALGAIYQMTGKYQQALAAYSTAQLIDLSSPEPGFRGFECHLALQNYREAVCALETVIALSEGKKEHEALEKKAKPLLAELQAALRKAGA
jgi:type III secretion system low calcium response chaperone LcrH/SycD